MKNMLLLCVVLLSSCASELVQSSRAPVPGHVNRIGGVARATVTSVEPVATVNPVHVEPISGLWAFVCLCGVLLLIVTITMGYTRWIMPRLTSTDTRSTSQLIQEQHK